MKTLKYSMMVMVVILAMIYVPVSFGAVSPEEAAKLGTTLTGFGAEKAGNKDGTIPAYTGGLAKPPASYKPGSGVYTDPFAGEKPLFSINAQNMAQYADKLTEGTKVMMKRHSTFRIDVYKTNRTVAYPDFVIKNTAKNAVKATTYDGGVSMKDANGGIPFPIPKDGYEIMWNHLARYQGRAREIEFKSIIVDSNGRLILSGVINLVEENPYYDENRTRSDAKMLYKELTVFKGPPRVAGMIYLVFDYGRERVVYMYLPGQRRVKLAPEVAFDTPDASSGGSVVQDEDWVFNGSLERYDWKLVGKKEVYVPYNSYITNHLIKREQLYGPNHFNPDKVRWELHRVWVVDAILKPGKRHIYPKRRFYVDEDSWCALASENYDGKGFLNKIAYGHQNPRYDVLAPDSSLFVSYNVIANNYVGHIWMGEGGYNRQVEVTPENIWTPASIAGMGVR
jgi:hypothetical protein